MILKNFEISKKLDKNINFFLFYGQNTGLIEETIDQYFKTIFSKNIFYYDEAEIISNIDPFKEKILNKSFFENEKLIIVNRTTDKILMIMEDLLEKNIEDVKILLKSDNLEKKSKLRNFFEKNKATYAIAFYQDNNQILTNITQRFFNEKKVKISSQSINYIVEKSRGSRKHLRNELQKIASFCEKKSSVELDEIFKLINLSNNYDAAELAEQYLVKNKKKTLNILNENNQSIEDNIVFLKTLLYKLKRLKKLKTELDIKKNVDAVISSFKPPIFWKDKEIVRQQLKIWNLSQLKKSIYNISHLEVLIKKNSQISNQLVNDFIVKGLEKN